jgi:DNA-binding CsgD family transcriptional regulator
VIDRSIPGTQRLTRRELDVLQFAADGKTRNETAVWLRIAPNTVRTHRQNILRKLALHTFDGAVALGIRDGVIW